MRKLIESTLVSLDGIIESPERWAIFDEEATQRSMRELDNYDAFVLGRVTYERFRENWSSSGGNPYFDRIAAMPKYVASRDTALIKAFEAGSRLPGHRSPARTLVRHTKCQTSHAVYRRRGRGGRSQTPQQSAQVNAREERCVTVG
jgi:hypothetical protein